MTSNLTENSHDDPKSVNFGRVEGGLDVHAVQTDAEKLIEDAKSVEIGQKLGSDANDEQKEPDGAVVEGSEAEILASDMEFFSDGLREKTIGKIEELGDRLGEICGGTPSEIEAARNFVQDLAGKYKGWRLIVDVKVAVRRTPA